ncbi:MAG: EAL domain-containing protein [Coleofasciculaceae cyanobacterium SM2_3_26]|nr:EAL domain-containing protein [Coleofasciculaceae cyanobacterium SM2_3_26]
MAHQLELKVIAEGVETPEELSFMTELGCNEMQGYLYSPPLPAAPFAELAISGKRL